MDDFKRFSPVTFKPMPVASEVRRHWTVVTAYEDEGPGPWLVDMSHQARWDLQDGRLDERVPGGVAVPFAPGECLLENRILVSRMNRTQASVWHLAGGSAPALPAEPGYTDLSEATLLLGMLGPGVLAIAEHLSALDFAAPGQHPPFLLQGPFSRVPCQIVVLAREKRGGPGLLLACPRGYGADMVQAVLGAGAAHGLRPAGEDRFHSWLNRWAK